MDDQVLTIEYEFKLQSGEKKQFSVRLEKPGLRFIAEYTTTVRHWTRLEHCQCPNCPLRPTAHLDCPIAANLVDIIESFRNSLSIEEADVTIRSEQREYHKRSTVQDGISSLMGIYMVTSGCPIMDKLRPMAFTHLPFASLEETLYRAISMYLLAQYFREQAGETADWKLEKFTRLYKEIATVNQSFTRRLLSINPRDASLNALVELDCFATAAAFSDIADNVKEFEPLFGSFLKCDNPVHPPDSEKE